MSAETSSAAVDARPRRAVRRPARHGPAKWTHRLPLQGRTPFVDIPVAGRLLSSTMSVIAHAIADRQGEIDRLQAAIKALTDVEQLLGASAPAAGSASRRSSRRKATAAAAESQPEVKPQRKRREMTAAEKKAVSERMTVYWAERRKKAPKKKAARSRQRSVPPCSCPRRCSPRPWTTVARRHPDRHQVN